MSEQAQVYEGESGGVNAIMEIISSKFPYFTVKFTLPGGIKRRDSRDAWNAIPYKG